MPYVKNPDGSMRFVKDDDIESPELEPIGAGPQWDDGDFGYTPLPVEQPAPNNLSSYTGYTPPSGPTSQPRPDLEDQEDVRRLIDYLEQKRKEALARGDNEAAEYYEDTLMAFDPEEGIDKYGRRIPKYDQEYFIKNTVGKHARDVLWSLQREEKEVKASHVKKQINASVTMNPRLRELFREAMAKGFRSYDALKGSVNSAWGRRLSDIAVHWPNEYRREYAAAAESLFNELATQDAMATIPEVKEDHERGKEDRRRRGYTEEQIESSDNDALISEGRDVREQEEIAGEERQREVDRIAQTDESVQKRVEQESKISEKPKRKGHWTPVVGPGGRSDFIPTEPDENYNKRLTQWRKSESAKPLYLLQRMLRLSDGEIPSTEEIIERINIMREATGLDPFPFDANDPQTQALLQGLVNKAQQWNKEEGQKGIEYRNLMLKAQGLAEESEKQHRIFSLRTGGTDQKYKDEAIRLHLESLKTLGSARKDFDEFLRPRLEAANRMDVVRMWEDVFGAAQFNINKTTVQENLETLHFAGQSTLGHTISYVWNEQGRKRALFRRDDKAVKYHENALADLANPGTPLYDPDPARTAQMVYSYKTSLGPGLAAWYEKYYLPSDKDSPLARAIADIGLIPVSWAQAGGNMAIQGVGGLLQIAGIPGSAEFNRDFVKLSQTINAAYDKLHTDAFGEFWGGELALARSGIASLAAIIGVSLVTGGVGGMTTAAAIFWGSSFSESYVEAKEQGKSGTEAYVYGNIMGFAEVAPMMLGAKWLKMPGMLKYLNGIGAVEGGALTNAAKTGLQSAIRRWSQFMTKDLLKSMGEESFQELLTLAIGRLAQGAMGMETFENSFEGWLEQITEVIKATAYSMGAGQLGGSVGVYKGQQQQLSNAAAAGKKIAPHITSAGQIVDDAVSTVKVAVAVRDNLAAFTAFINNPTRQNAAKLNLPLRKGESRQAFAKRIKPIVDFYTTEQNQAQENAERQNKGQEPLKQDKKTVTYKKDIGIKDSEGNPIYRVFTVPVTVDPSIPAEDRQEAAEKKASKHKTVDGKPVQVVPKSETHQKTTVTVQDESGNEQDLIVYVPKSRITEDRTAENIAHGDLGNGVEIDGKRFAPVETAPQDPLPQTGWVEPEESIEDIESEVYAKKYYPQENTEQVEPEAPSDYTGAGAGKPLDQQIAEQEQQPEVEEDIEEDVEEAPVEDGPTTPTQRQFKIVGPDQTGQESTITVWAKDENDAFAKGKEEGVTGTKIKKTREKNTFQEDDAQQEQQLAPEEQQQEEGPSYTSTDPKSVLEKAQQDSDASFTEKPVMEILERQARSLRIPVVGHSVESLADEIAKANGATQETIDKYQEMLDETDRVDTEEETAEEAPVEETTTEETPQYDEDGYDKDGVTEDGIIADRNMLLAPLSVMEGRVDTMTVEEAEQRVANIDHVFRDPGAEFDDRQRNAFIEEKETLEKQIAIAKQRRGKTATEAAPGTAPETAPTQKTTQQKKAPGRDAREWSPAQRVAKIDEFLEKLDNANKKDNPDAPAAKVAEANSAAALRAREFAKSLGVELIFVDGDTIPGARGVALSIDGAATGVVAVRANEAENAIFAVAIHEIMHGTELDLKDFGMTEAEFKTLTDLYLAKAPANKREEFRRRMATDPVFARREANAMLAQTLVEDGTFRREFAKEQPGLFKKVVDAFIAFFETHPTLKMTRAQRNLLNELKRLANQNVEVAPTFQSAMDNVIEMDDAKLDQEAKKRNKKVGGQNKEQKQRAVADDMQAESAADNRNPDAESVNEKLQEHLKHTEGDPEIKDFNPENDPNYFNFELLPAQDPTSTFTLYDQSNKDGYIQEEVGKAKRLPGYADAAEKATREARDDYVKRVKAGDRTIPEGTEVTVGDWTFTMGADNAGKSYPTLLSATYSPQDDSRVLEQIEDDSGEAAGRITTEEKKEVEETKKCPKGECYSKAARYAMDSGGENTVVVHGKVTNDEGKRFGHAWIEEGGEVFDPSTGVRVPKDKYYELLDAEVENRYLHTHIALNLAKVGKHGPWTSEEIGDRHLPVTPTPTEAASQEETQDDFMLSPVDDSAENAKRKQRVTKDFVDQVFNRIKADPKLNLDEAIEASQQAYAEKGEAAGVDPVTAWNHARQFGFEAVEAAKKWTSDSTIKIIVDGKAQNVTISIPSMNAAVQSLLESYDSDTTIPEADEIAVTESLRNAASKAKTISNLMSILSGHHSLSIQGKKTDWSPDDQAMITIGINYVQDRLKENAKQLERAHQDGNRELSQDVVHEKQDLMKTLEWLALLDKKVGTDLGRSLRLRKGRSIFDKGDTELDVTDVLTSAIVEKGEALTEKEEAKLRASVEKQQQAAKKATKMKRKVTAEQAEALVNEQLKDKKLEITEINGQTPTNVDTVANVNKIKDLLSRGC